MLTDTQFLISISGVTTATIKFKFVFQRISAQEGRRTIWSAFLSSEREACLYAQEGGTNGGNHGLETALFAQEGDVHVHVRNSLWALFAQEFSQFSSSRFR